MTPSVKSLSEIPTLTLLYKLGRLHASSAPVANATPIYNDKISLIRTDITKLGVSAIVNAANESLLGGGGVDGAIHRAAGPQLYKECSKLDGCDTGNAKITSAYELPCDKVIHAVGPVYRSTKRQGKHTSLLQGCYRNSLNLAVENGCKSIAFSALSTGVYGYPSDEAAETAIGEVKKWLDEDEGRAGKLERIVFCSFEEKDEKAYEQWIPTFFPPAIDTTDPTSDGGKADVETKSDEGSILPTLPDAPTKEPAEQLQRDAKRQKTSHLTDDVARPEEADNVVGIDGDGIKDAGKEMTETEQVGAVGMVGLEQTTPGQDAVIKENDETTRASAQGAEEKTVEV